MVEGVTNPGKCLSRAVLRRERWDTVTLSVSRGSIPVVVQTRLRTLHGYFLFNLSTGQYPSIPIIMLVNMMGEMAEQNSQVSQGVKNQLVERKS